jgi:hypothetical protein
MKPALVLAAAAAFAAAPTGAEALHRAWLAETGG